MSITVQLAKLPQMTVGELLDHYAELFGETTASRNKGWLIKRIAWRLQANAHGGLSERARLRAAELSDERNLRHLAPRETNRPQAIVPAPIIRDSRLPAPGSVLIRVYKGRRLQVAVREDGFEFEGQIYGSLSAVAKTITGSHCNGFQFFQLTGDRS